ncbi:sugar ABC transporter substrate-binding protein [Nocardioides szechwanensis]|uniref:Cellobiose-binding protein n=1 Tax=Nocardioides szechwanensis TaxID=1005944 RepID=A0A1H0BJW2_9ACTN|nr:ABC transporter substrate-binding protein [Nocardioides szechwanensis]GEP36122.1 sugar ABC transporter substrate-binding protein [Nocardioides szechwanensis]SDN45871.1 cellobiose-binding protein [Nocardioides szechwanensis]
MSGASRRKGIALAATGAVVLSLGLAACGGDDEGSEDGKITLTVATFNEFGYEDLLEEYMDLNPDIKVVQKKLGTWEEHRDNLYTKLAAGSGLSDIEAIEGDGMPAILEEADAFTDLSDSEVDGRWLDWKQAAGTSADGKLIGYGTDIGPEGICYRADLFEKAGLPTDRAEVAPLFADWDTYFATGQEFIKKLPDTAWYDSSKGTSQAMINQLEFPFETADNEVVATTNPEVKEVFDTVTSMQAAGLATNLDQWSNDWVAAFQNDGFATMACPGWMLGIIEGNAAGVTGWDIADAFPGGGGNWGGSFLTVPAQSEHPDEAKALANWLTAPEQQIKAFEAKNTFPSQVEALSDPALLEATNAFFNDAPTGEILSNRAQAVTVQPYKGPKYADIIAAFQAAILRVDEGQETPDEAWDSFTADVERIG